MMLKVTDDNDKRCMINEKYITAVHCYTSSNGNGRQLRFYYVIQDTLDYGIKMRKEQMRHLLL